jgi:hypothetical protein
MQTNKQPNQANHKTTIGVYYLFIKKINKLTASPLGVSLNFPDIRKNTYPTPVPG